MGDSEVELFVEDEDVFDVAVAESLEMSFRGFKLQTELVKCLLEMRENGLEVVVID